MFITFTNVHTRLCWVSLLKERSEVGQIIKFFVNWCKQNLIPKLIMRLNTLTLFWDNMEMGLFIKARVLTHPNKMELQRGKIDTS